jgi:hypothetical protein
VAFVVPAPTSDPAPGSVSTIVAPQCSSSIFATYRAFCASVPSASMIYAIMLPST